MCLDQLEDWGEGEGGITEKQQFGGRHTQTHSQSHCMVVE